MNTDGPPKDLLGNGHNLPLLAQGEFEGYSWEFRGHIVGDLVREWSQVRGPNGGGGGGGGGGALPFADLGWKVLGHIGSFDWSSGGWSRKGLMRRTYHPGTISGIVSADVCRVTVNFKDGEAMGARLFESGRDDVRFFFLIHSPRREWADIVAFGPEGTELDRADHKSFLRI